MVIFDFNIFKCSGFCSGYTYIGWIVEINTASEDALILRCLLVYRHTVSGGFVFVGSGLHSRKVRILEWPVSVTLRVLYIQWQCFIKAEFLWWIIVVRHSNFQMIWRKKMKRLKIEFWRCLFWGPLFSLTVSKWTSFSDPHSFSKQVAIWSWLLLLKIETHTLNMKTY